MLHHDLNYSWKFKQSRDKQWLRAVVPGCVHNDLLRNKKIADPFYGKNELDVQWIEERDWTYELRFKITPEMARQDYIDLVAEGLDTVAAVYLNEKLLFQSENMFQSHRHAIKKRLRSGVNILRVEFASPANYLRTHRADFTPIKEFNDPVGNSVRIRKMQCNFGWDWGPRLVTSGIWKAIRLEAWSINRIESVRIFQHHEKSAVKLKLETELAVAGAGEIKASVRLKGKVVAEFFQGEASIEKPQLWWPVGWGEQNLYEIKIELVVEGKVIDHCEKRIGLRTIELQQAPDAHGHSFQFVVNQQPIFAKGANFIPVHTFVAGLKREDYAGVVRAAVEANMNMLRVWGGGLYENNAFYDLCDEAGILVWQDFCFACNTYPGDDDFLASVQKEAEQNIARLRHHASLALWCGNNEIWMLNPEMQQPENKEKYLKPYQDLFLKLLPEVVEKNDGVTPYWASSPQQSFEDKRDGALVHGSGDTHFWDVWHARHPVSRYELTSLRFCSEFGMQSYPSPEIAATFCPPEEMNVFGDVFENHQKNRAGNQIILDYVSRLYRFPKDYAALAYLSQLNQAYCMKAGVEHWRRSMPKTMGALYWQINDCWPVASWSSLEFGGKWKVLHHWARRFFSPALISIKHHGEESTKVGNYYVNSLGKVDIYTVYDGRESLPTRMSYRLETLAGKVLVAKEKSVSLKPNESVKVATVDFSKELDRVGRSQAVLLVQLISKKGELLSENTAYFTAPRFLKLEKTPIKQSIKRRSENEYALTLQTKSLHYAVHLGIEGGAWFSDNSFDLPANRSKVIIIRVSKALRSSLEKKLTIFSLVHSYS